MSRPAQSGFTLIELVVTMVILTIMATASIRYITATAQAFSISARISALASGGRIAIERIGREVRAAVPNSVRVSNTTNCLEFMPHLGVTRYMLGGEVDSPDATAVAKTFPLAPTDPATGLPITTLSSSEFSILEVDTPAEIAGADFVAVNPQRPDEVYSVATVGPVNALSTVVDSGAAGGFMRDVQMADSHGFPDNSPSFRVYFADQPVSFCVGADGQLRRYSNYAGAGLNVVQFNPDNALPAGTQVMVVADNIANNDPVAGDPAVFTYGPGAAERKAIVNVLFHFEIKENSLALNHEIQMRNSP